jgi:uncharacterized protein YdaU (DUF1376 family)
MKPPAFQFYADDFLGGTMHFSDAEIGLYIRLLCVQWSTGGLPNNDDELLSYGKPSQNPTLSRVKAKFKLCDDGMLRNERMEREREKQVEYRLRQSENGKRGGRPTKAERNPTLSQAFANPNPTPNPNESFPSPVSVSSLQVIPPTPLQGEPAKEDCRPAEPKTKGPLQLRAERIFHRKPCTPLDRAEARALKAARAAIEATSEDDWKTLEAYYAAKIPEDKDARRRSLGTLLNNWNGEIDRAKGYLNGNSKPAQVNNLKYV